MRNMRKLLAIVLCLLLVTTSFATVSAEESKFSGIVSKTVEVSENGDVKVLIDIAGNPGLTAIKLWVSYDTDVLTVKENGIKDTKLLVGKIQNTFIAGNFPLSWQDSGSTAENNDKNGTIAEIEFKVKEGFIGTTDVTVDIEFAQTFVNGKFKNAPPMDSGVVTVTREKLAIKDGVAIANSVNGETLIIASYDEDDMMIDCKAYPNSVGDVEISIADVINTNGAIKVKAFLWKDLQNLVPVCNCAEKL